MKKTYIIPETIEIEINTCRIMVATSPTDPEKFILNDDQDYDDYIIGGMK